MADQLKQEVRFALWRKSASVLDPGSSRLSHFELERPGNERFYSRLFRVVVLASICCAFCYVVLARPGTPADEPSHFSTVQFYAAHHAMPVLGREGVSYEGQMGPVFYALAAFVYSLFAGFHGHVAFYMLRSADVLLLIPMLALTRRIAARVFPEDPVLVLTVVVFSAFNPSILAIAASVQNDMLTVVLCLWGTDLAMRWSPAGQLTNRRAAILAIIVSLAILTKSSAIYLFPSVVLLMAWHRNLRRLSVGIFSLGVPALTGWWFLRNKLLYGDWTAQKGLRDNGYHNAPPPVPLNSPHAVGHWLWQIVAYYWYLTEYYRGLFHASAGLLLISGSIITLASLGWAFIHFKRAKPPLVAGLDAAFLTLCFGLCMAVYTVSCFRFTFFAARTTFGVFVCYAILMSVGLNGFLHAGKPGFRLLGPMLITVFLITANVIILFDLASLKRFAFNF